jgi:putative ABC transport system permease protein
VVGVIGLTSTMSANILDRTREFGVMHAIGARPRSVRRMSPPKGASLPWPASSWRVIPTLGLTALLGAGLGNLFFSAPLPYRISLPAIIWTAVVILGAILATEAARARAVRLTVRDALAYL